jgi:DNA polymerase III subunit epsilon
MKALVYDTETTGLPLFSEPSEDPRQPHIVQIAALLVDLDTRKTLATLDLTIAPLGWEIPEEVVKIHGISTAIARSVGVPEALAVQLFMELWSRADVRIGHNEQFDARIIRCALHRYTHLTERAPMWKSGRSECTQQLATPILKLPPTQKMLAAGFNKHKSANLREAYRHFYGDELVGAHSAIEDAKGCMHVYFAIKTPRAIPAAAAGVHA